MNDPNETTSPEPGAPESGPPSDGGSNAASPPPPDATPPSSPPPTPPPAAALPGDDLPSADEKQWAMFAHLSALLGALITTPICGLGSFLGPLIIWLVKKDTMKFVDDQGKEALNFNITLAIIGLAMLIFSMITFGIGLILTVPLAVVLLIVWFVLSIVAAIKASNGEFYRYPMTIRLVK